MRYYSIVITDPSSGGLLTTASSLPGSGATYSSFANGQTVPGALNIELDVVGYPFAQPKDASYVRIWGITVEEISQAIQFGATPAGPGKTIAIYAGMQKGLPLANPAQAGLIAQGEIFQAFGNWISTDMTLDFILYPPLGSPTSPKNVVVDWKAGTPLAQAIANTLATAFPAYKQDIKISPKLVLAHDEPGYYNSIVEFAQWVLDVSQDIKVAPDYPGVSITLSQNTFRVYDGTTQTTPKLIAFQDLIGQPTWIEDGLLVFKTVVRADLQVGDYVQIPPAVVTTTAAAANSLLNLKAAFQGVFQINDVHHYGNFRQPDADAWTTRFEAAPIALQAAA